MSSDSPDFQSFSTKELRRVLGVIDREKYPERLEEVLTILAEREQSQAAEPQKKVSPSQDSEQPSVTIVDGTSVKRGRSHSLVSGIFSVVFGGIWIWAVMGMFDDQLGSVSLPFRLLFYCAGAASIFGGVVAIYNALARNRFSEYDVVSSEKEPDPLSRFLDSSKRNESDGPKT